MLPGGTIGKASALGADAIRNLVAQQVTPPARRCRTADRRCRSGCRLASQPQTLRLESLDGEPAAFADFQGEKMLALFWNTQCGYCSRMLPQLKEGSQPT